MGRKLQQVSTALAIDFLARMLVRTYTNTLSDTHNGFNLNVSAAVDYCPNYPPMHNKGPRSKKASGSSACDPVTVLDDDEPDTAEINYIDLETDGGALTEENCTASIKHSVAGTHGTGVSKVVKTNSPYNTTQGPDLAGRTKRNVSLLFRPLTTDDSSAPSVQAVPEKRGIGFKAWYSKIDPFLTVRPVREMQQKQVSKNPSIALINKERTQSMTTRNRDAPQLDMNVLESKRKRTMGELGYNELISPAQIESPSEKLARLTKKRRKRQERCDLLLQITNAGDAAINERKTASASSASVPVPIQTTLTHVPIDIQIVTPAPLAKTRATPLDSDTRAPTVADLSGSRPTIKDHTSSSSHLGSKLDQLESLVEHRATAGKGLSQETLRRFQKTGSWNCGMEMDQNAVEVEAEETEVPNIAYHYFVRKREWLETEEDAIESSLGPFLTMNEANAVAKAEVQSPQVDGYEEIQPSGWSYYYEQDEYGMQMHMATVLEIHIETAVHRSKCHSLGLFTRNIKLIQMY